MQIANKLTPANLNIFRLHMFKKIHTEYVDFCVPFLFYKLQIVLVTLAKLNLGPLILGLFEFVQIYILLSNNPRPKLSTLKFKTKRSKLA